MGLFNRIAAKTDEVKGRTDEDRGERKGDEFLAALGRAEQERAEARKAAEADEDDRQENSPPDAPPARPAHDE